MVSVPIGAEAVEAVTVDMENGVEAVIEETVTLETDMDEDDAVTVGTVVVEKSPDGTAVP